MKRKLDLNNIKLATPKTPVYKKKEEQPEIKTEETFVQSSTYKLCVKKSRKICVNPFRSGGPISSRIKPYLPNTEVMMSMYDENIILPKEVMGDKIMYRIKPPEILESRNGIINIGGNLFMFYGKVKKIVDYPNNLISTPHLLILLKLLHKHESDEDFTDCNINAFNVDDNQWLISDNLLGISKVFFNEHRLIIKNERKRLRKKLSTLTNLCLRMDLTRVDNRTFFNMIYEQLESRVERKFDM